MNMFIAHVCISTQILDGKGDFYIFLQLLNTTNHADDVMYNRTIFA